MKKLSVARKFKMITSQDIMRVSKLLEKKEKDENCNDVSDTIEFIEYGLYLAFYEADLAKAKSEFALFEENGEYDTGEETIKSLMERFKSSFG